MASILSESMQNYILLSRINYFDLTTVELILKKNKISFFVKNIHESSIMAGWASPGESFNERLLFI